MTFKQLKLKIKQEQKERAKQIRRWKFLRKPKNRTDMTDEDKKLYFVRYGESEWFKETLSLRRDFRYNHVAYCNMFNGTPIKRIEQPREDNIFTNNLVKILYKEQIKKWESLIDEETIRPSAA